MKVIYNRFIPFGGYKLINLFGVVFAKSDEPLKPRDLNHEKIHTEQQHEVAVIALSLLVFCVFFFDISWWWCLLCLPAFYILYGLEYVIIRLFHKKQNGAYHDVSFEEEAYHNDEDLEYIEHREPLAWVRYLKPKSWKGE